MQVVYLNPSEERKAYEDSIKYYRDLKNSMDTARFEGLQEGMEIGEQVGLEKGKEAEKREVAKRMLAKGLEPSLVAELTGLDLKDAAS